MYKRQSGYRYRKGYVTVRAKLLAGGNVYRDDFPTKRRPLIAINDGVDSAQGDNDFAPLRNIFNEWLVRDTSKKIKAVKRSKGMSGKPVTSKPVYGYLMDCLLYTSRCV